MNIEDVRQDLRRYNAVFQPEQETAKVEATAAQMGAMTLDELTMRLEQVGPEMSYRVDQDKAKDIVRDLDRCLRRAAEVLVRHASESRVI